MKSKLGSFLVMLALSSVVMMLGYQQYAPREAGPSRQGVLNLPTPGGDRDPISRKRPARRSIERDQPTEPQASSVTLYAMRARGETMALTPVRTQVSEATPLGALKALAAFQLRGEIEPILSKGTQVNSVTVSPSGDATADFSRDLVENFPGGSRTEQLMIASIVSTLTQFRTVKRVTITVDGKPVDSIGGHIELDEPLTRADALAFADAKGGE